MEQEVNMKIACIAIQTTESAGKAFTRAMKGFIERQAVDHSNVTKNKAATEHKEPFGKMVKVKDLRKDGSQIEFVDMGQDELKDFRRYARKYGVSYSMEKNKASDPPTYLIYFKAKDSNLITKAISSYVSDKLKDVDVNKEEGIASKLEAAKEKAASQVKKVRNKEKVR